MYTSSIKHVDQVLSRSIAFCPGRKGTSAQTSDAAVKYSKSVGIGLPYIGEGLSICIVEVASYSIEGNVVFLEEMKEVSHVFGTSDSKGVAEANFVAAHLEKGLYDLENGGRRSQSIERVFKDARHIASDESVLHS